MAVWKLNPSNTIATSSTAIAQPMDVSSWGWMIFEIPSNME